MISADRLVFSLDEIPFSRRGAWLDLSRVVAPHTVSEHVHLVSHRSGMHAVLELVPGDEPLELRASASSVRWSFTDGIVEATFDGDRIRLRGCAAELTFRDGQPDEPFRGSHVYTDPVDGATVFASMETGRRYRIEAVAGALEPVRDAYGRAAVRAVGGHWEVEITEFNTAPIRSHARRPFDEVVSALAEDFQAFAGSLIAKDAVERPASALAAYVVWSAMVAPDGFVTRDAVLMSMNWMDRVWSWDHCFNALALAAGESEAAWQQFLLVFDHQDPSGALPDLVGHSVLSYSFVKPPVHGWAVMRLLETLPETGPDRRRELLDRLVNLTRFWLDARVVPGHRLPHYLHGNDSGWDNSTMFDSDQPVEAPDLTALLVLQLEAMARLADSLSDARAHAWRARADGLLAALQDELWQKGTFVGRLCSDGSPTATSSLLRLLPLLVADRLSPEITSGLVAQLRDHLTEWGLATELPSSPEYQADGYWRGPIWAPPTLMLTDGLRRVGEHELANTIRERFLRLCEEHGFAENFDAFSGRGLRDLAYTWTAACYLVLANEIAVEQ